ncbi:MAG: hypothetical protein HY400_07750 [Elusimicrobia bacterium]|nr:hypothetical protein [Elusimicrobiota bacterium]
MMGNLLRNLADLVWLLVTVGTLYLEWLVYRSRFSPEIKWGWAVMILISYLGATLLCLLFSQPRKE